MLKSKWAFTWKRRLIGVVQAEGAEVEWVSMAHVSGTTGRSTKSTWTTLCMGMCGSRCHLMEAFIPKFSFFSCQCSIVTWPYQGNNDCICLPFTTYSLQACHPVSLFPQNPAYPHITECTAFYTLFLHAWHVVVCLLISLDAGGLSPHLTV